MAIVCAAGAQPGTDAAATAVDVPRRAGVHCVHEDDIGFLWMCTGEGLARFDGRATVTFGPGAGELRALLHATDGQVWTAGVAGVFEFVMAPDPGREPYLQSVPQPGGASPVHALFQARDGSIWCATDAGVLRLADRRLTEIEIGLPADGPGRAVRALVVDESGALWAGAASGLYVRTTDGRTARFTTADGLPSDDVRAVALDADGRLWVGTPAGLALVYRGAIERGEAWAVRTFTVEAGLPSNDVRALHLAGRTLWLGTGGGTAALRGFGADRLDLERVDDGFATRALSSATGGDIWVTAEDGVRVYRIGRPRSTPTVITAIRVDGRAEPIPAGGVPRAALSLPWHADLVEIEFVSPRAHILDAGRVHYQVRSAPLLDGASRLHPILDRPPQLSPGVRSGGPRPPLVVPGNLFVPLPHGLLGPGAGGSPVVLRQFREETPSRFDARAAAYPDRTGWLTLPEETPLRAVIEHPASTLERGAHRFDVHASVARSGVAIDNQRTRSGERASVEITVAVAPWVQWWFLAPLGLAVAALAFAWRRHRAGHEREIARVRSRIAADLHDSVGASLTRIAILSDVASQRAHGRLPDVVPDLQVIGENARAVIDEMNDAVWLIESDAGDLQEMLVRIRTVAAALFDPDGIAWHAEAPDDVLGVRLTAGERRHMFLIVKEALTNARRHAHASMVTVRISLRDRRLRIEIEDDGVGMPEEADEAGGQGRGTESMRARARDLGGTLTVERRSDGPGSRATLEVPRR